MRYTTLIDIREVPEVYRNHNVRLVYLHLVLAAGWHDDDRDQVRVSIREMAGQTGLTVSAVRHALRMLSKSGLLQTVNGHMVVTKYVIQDLPSKRPRTKQEQQLQTAAQERKRQEAANDERKRQEEADNKRRRDAVVAYLKTHSADEIQTWRDDVQAKLDEGKPGRSVYHDGLAVPARVDVVEWLDKWIASKRKVVKTKIT